MRTNAVVSVLTASLMLVTAGCGGSGSEAPLSPAGKPAVALPTVPTEAYSPEVATEWMDLAWDLVRTERIPPPQASRIYGYAGVTLYEAVVPGMPDFQSLAGQLNDLGPLPSAHGPAYHWPTVANSASATVLRHLFIGRTAASLAAIDALEDAFVSEFQPRVRAGIFKRSVEQGEAVGQAIADWSDDDGYATYNNCAFTPPAGPGLWVPTPPAFAAPLQPCWGQLRPFVLESGASCAPPPHPAYSTDLGSDFYAEGLEVYLTVNNLTQPQLDIALFWADNPGQTGTPPGHSINILTQIIAQENASLAVAAEGYAKVGIAVADAFIACWNTKFTYNLLRPITYVRNVIDPAWNCPIPTPPFAEYTSGHSVQSGASAQVLTDMFGEVAFVDHTNDHLGYAPRPFDNFFEAANEAAISRLYGGIHFRSAIELGIEQGICIGQEVSALDFKRFRKSVL